MLQVRNFLKCVSCNFAQRNYQKIARRTFLSPAYYCNEVWNHRLSSPLLEKVNLDEFYQEIDQRYTRLGVLSAIDADIFVNAVRDEIFIDEMLDITYKLRMTVETTNTLNSTSHAVVRCMMNSERKDDLLSAIDDRLNYGLFLDYYTGNLLMDKLYKEKDFLSGVRVAQQFMLQEESDHPITTGLALLHCYNFLLNPKDWPVPPKPEEPEDVVKVRVKYLRNPYDDSHFDLVEAPKIVGKTLMSFTKKPADTLQRSLHLLGRCLFGNDEKTAELVQQYSADNLPIYADIIKLVPDENPIKPELAKLKSETGDVAAKLEALAKEAVNAVGEKDISTQCETYAAWEQERKSALNAQKERLLTQERLASVEVLQKELRAKEEKLWFFENEEQIELEIEEKEALKPDANEAAKQTK